MAQSDEKQTIKEFVNNLLDDLAAGRITPEAAIVAAGQYEGLRKTLAQNAEVLAASVDANGGPSVETVSRALDEASASIEASPPQFQVEKPDAPLLPKDVLARAAALRSSEKIVTGAISRQQKNVALLRKTFIERLVDNWIARSRSEIEAGAIDESAIIQKLEILTDEELSGPNAARTIEAAFTGVPAAKITTEHAVRDAISESGNTKSELARQVRVLSGVRGVLKALYPRAGSPGLERFAAIATSIVASSGLPADAAIDRADTLSRVAEAIVDPRGRREDGEVIPAKFFTVITQGPAQKLIAGAADALFSQLSPLTRQDVIRATFSRALEQTLAKTDDLTTGLGKDFVESELFRLVIDGTKKEFARAPSSGSGAKQARGALDDILSAVLLGPVTAPLLTNPKEAILAYFELLSINARLPKGTPAILPGKLEAAALLLAAAGTGGAAPAGGAVASVLTAGASSLAKQLPSWERFYLMMLSLVSPGMTSAQPPSLGTGLPSFGAPTGSGLGGAIGGALSWAGLGLAGGVVKAGGGLIGLLFGGALPSPFGRRTEKTSFWDDTPLMIAIFVGASIVLLFIFPTFFNFLQTKKTAENAALLVASAQISAGGPYDETFPEYGGPFPDGPTSITSCAVDYKHLTQTPFDPGGIKTHVNTCAYDFDAPQHSSVRAVHSGYVAAVRFDIPDNKKIRGSYGNYVLIAGKTTGGQVFYSRYAHLAQNSPGSLVVGRPIGANDIIGEIDNTGNTTGPHLHLEFLNENQGYVTESQCSSVFLLPPGCTQ